MLGRLATEGEGIQEMCARRPVGEEEAIEGGDGLQHCHAGVGDEADVAQRLQVLQERLHLGFVVARRSWDGITFGFVIILFLRNIY